ncbi:hypothetical protein [Metabacillus iocasae]|uniref:Uncharacterized protein n=1 Tax=Priestia iocasae TaxID=2291674 RepID=A0ABS2QWC2_9BACI|nr:hypothetical protein [Metabacillus iocasae]MBM7703700.1 hypothetical protein [Metabacillus iocasae]
MASFFNKANEQLMKLLKSENGGLKKAKKTMNDSGMKIPITSNMMTRLLKMKTEEHKQLKELTVSFEGSSLCIKGMMNKLFIDIPFEIKLYPIKADKRTLHFHIHYLKPTNAEWLKKRIFHKPPFMLYQQDSFELDLNQMKKISIIPIGTIKHFEIKDEKLWVTIGL